ncbi:hypothetical protein [Rhizobium sp. P32RR-XVIII]|nr:hypothetical protein [Rhizobium sp. P32RR-XVIII]
MDLRKLEWEVVTAVLGTTAGVLVLVGAVFVWSGVYNIAESEII